MRELTWRRASPSAVLLVVLVLSAAAALVATSRYGIGMTPDSVVYRDGAQSLAAGRGYVHNDGTPIVNFAPGYSAVLSVGERLGADPADAARLLAVACFMATTALGHVLLSRHVRSPALVGVGTVVIGCSAVLLGVFDEALSEHLFIVVVLLLVLAAEALVERPSSLRLLAGAIALAWAAFYLRYAGVVVVPFMALVLLVTGWRHGRVVAMARAGAYSLLALSTPALWMLRNIDAGADALGGRHEAATALPTNVARTAITLSGWLSFSGPSPLRLAVFLLAMAAAAAAVVVVRPSRGAVARHLGELWPMVLFVALYVGYLIVTASLVGFAPIQTRFLIEVYVPLVVLGTWTFERVRPHLSPAGRRVVTGLALAWVAGNVAWFGARAVSSAADGAGGYATATWHDSPLMEEVARVEPTIAIVTNDVHAIELFTGRLVTETVAATYIGSNRTTGDLARFVERVRCAGPLVLVWFDGPGTRTRLYTPEQLATEVELVPRVRRDDGVIYDVTARPDATTALPCDPAA